LFSTPTISGTSIALNYWSDALLKIVHPLTIGQWNEDFDRNLGLLSRADGGENPHRFVFVAKRGEVL
jgi:hypothetical protein